MHIIYLTVPSSGQANVQLATAQALLDQGNQVTFISGQSFSTTIKKLQSKQQNTSSLSSNLDKNRLQYISLGSERAVEDFTPVVQNRIQHMRKAPGDFSSISTCMEIALVSADEHIAAALKVRNHIINLNADMVIVDCLSPALISGVRMTNKKWLLSIPCSPGFTSIQGIFSPHPVAANRSGSWWTAIENIRIRSAQYRFCRNQTQMTSRRMYLRDIFGLQSFGLSNDLTLLPPYWEDVNCLGGIHYNVAGLNDTPIQPASLVFVGAGIIEDEPSDKICAVMDWLNEAKDRNEDVVYVNMGSMFIWTQMEFSHCIQGLCAVYQSMQGRVRFVLKVNKPLDGRPAASVNNLPPFIRQTYWVESQHALFRHSSLKVIIHHGGGNLFNEAVYFGVPQLILSQWLDTHELGQLANTFGFGLSSACPPCIESSDIHWKLLRLLGSDWNSFKSNANTWSIRSKLGGGAASAAKIILAHAQSQKLLINAACKTPQF